MLPVILSITTFFSTLTGGITALRNQKRLNLIMGYTAGVLLGVVAFDVLPEISNITNKYNLNITHSMVALVLGFLLFHILEKTILMHHGHENQYGEHTHPHAGIAGAIALSGHSFLDGIGIGLAFQVNNTVGITVAIAVIAHDFSDGLNTVVFMLRHKNRSRNAFKMLLVDALAPVIGAASTLLFTLSQSWLAIYLGFFAGFLLYMAPATSCPGPFQRLLTKHHRHDHLGTVFIFIVTRFA